MVDATHVNTAAAKLLAVERRSLRDDLERASEAGPSHRFKGGRGNQPEPFDGTLRARAERHPFGELDERRQHLNDRSDTARCAAPNQLLQQLDPEIDLLLGNLERRRKGEDVLVIAAD